MTAAQLHAALLALRNEINALLAEAARLRAKLDN